MFTRLIGQVAWLAGPLVALNVANLCNASLPVWLGEEVGDLHAFLVNPLFLVASLAAMYGQRLYGLLPPAEAEALPAFSLAWYGQAVRGPRALLALLLLYVIRTMPRRLEARKRTGPIAFGRALVAFERAAASMTRSHLSTAARRAVASNAVGTDRVLLHELRVESVAGARAANALHRAAELGVAEEVGMPPIYPSGYPPKKVRLAADLAGLLLTRSRAAAAAEAAPARSMVECGEAVLVRMAALLRAAAAGGGGGGRAAAVTANADEFRAAVLRSAYTSSRLVSTAAVILFRLCQGLRRGAAFAPAEAPVATSRRNSLLAQLADTDMMTAWAGMARTLASQPSRCPPALLHLASSSAGAAPAAPTAPAALAAHELHWAVLGDAGRYLHALVHAAAVMCDKDRETALLAAHMAAAGQEPASEDEDEDEEAEEEGEEGGAGGRRRGRATGALAAEALVDALEASGLLEALCAAMLAATAATATGAAGAKEGSYEEQLAVLLGATALRQEAAAAREAAERRGSTAEGTGRASTSTDSGSGGGKGSGGGSSTAPSALAAVQYMFATSNLATALVMLTNLAGALPRMAAEIGAAALARRKARAAAGKAQAQAPGEGHFPATKAAELSRRMAALLQGRAVQRLQRCLLERFCLDQLEGEQGAEGQGEKGGEAGQGGKSGGGSCGWVLLDVYRMHDMQAQQIKRLDAEVVSADIDEWGSADAPRLTLLEPALSMWAAQSVGLAASGGASGPSSSDPSSGDDGALAAAPRDVVRAIGRAMHAVHVLLTSSDVLDPALMPTGSRYTGPAIAAASALAGAHKQFVSAPGASAASTRGFAVDALEAVAWALAVGTRAVAMELMAEDDEDDEEEGGGGGGGAGGRRQQGVTELGMRPVAYPLQVFRHMAEAHGEGFRKLPATDQAALARRLAAAHWPASLDAALRLGGRSLVRSGLRVANVAPGAGGPGAEVVRGVTCLLPSLSLLVCTPAAAPWLEPVAVADEAAAGAGGLLVSLGKLAAWLGTQIGRRGLPLTAAKPDQEADEEDAEEDDDDAKQRKQQQQQAPKELGGGEASALFDAMAGGLWQLVGTGALQPLGLAMPAGATAAAGSLAGGAALALGTSAEAAAELRGAAAFCLRGLCRAASARAFAACALPNGNAVAAQQRNTALGGTGACATWLGAPLATWLPAPRDLLPARPERLLTGVGVLLGRCMSDGGAERGALAGWSHAAAGALLALAAHEGLSGDVQGWLLAGSGAGGAGADAGSSFAAGMAALSYVLRAAGMQQDLEVVERLRAAAASAPREAGGDGGKATDADGSSASASGSGAGTVAKRAGGSTTARNRAGRGAGSGGRTTVSASFCGQAQQLLKEWNARTPRAAGTGAGPVEVAPAKACANPRCGRLSGPTEASLKPMQCSGCRTARYCCQVCQLEHWKAEGHKQECARGG